jgi:hypothetical protein
MSGKWTQQVPGPAAVVFVHGVLSSGDGCWVNVNGTNWPALDAQSAHELSVYVSTYRTGFDSGTFSVNDASDSVFEELQLDGLMQRKLLLFVCHSMGGLVVRVQKWLFCILDYSGLIQLILSVCPNRNCLK